MTSLSYFVTKALACPVTKLTSFNFLHTQVGIAQFSTNSALVLTETGEDGLEWRPAITSGSKAMVGRLNTKGSDERSGKFTCPPKRSKRDCFNIICINIYRKYIFQPLIFRCYVTSVSFREGFQPFWFRRSPPMTTVATYSTDFCLLGSPVSTKNSHPKSPLQWIHLVHLSPFGWKKIPGPGPPVPIGRFTREVRSIRRVLWNALGRAGSRGPRGAMGKKALKINYSNSSTHSGSNSWKIRIIVYYCIIWSIFWAYAHMFFFAL